LYRELDELCTYAVAFAVNLISCRAEAAKHRGVPIYGRDT
jgi:hypothetical protein